MTPSPQPITSQTVDILDQIIISLAENENMCYVAIELAYQLRDELNQLLTDNE